MFFQLGFAFLIPEILEKLNPRSLFCKDIKNVKLLIITSFNDLKSHV
jgi:hypothetical protein